MAWCQRERCTHCDGTGTTLYLDKNKQIQTGGCIKCEGSGQQPCDRNTCPDEPCRHQR